MCSSDPSTRLSYSEGVRKCASRLMDHSLSAENLLSRRAVVGWWGESEVILNGAADDGPSVRYSNTEPAKKCQGLRGVSWISADTCWGSQDITGRSIQQAPLPSIGAVSRYSSMCVSNTSFALRRGNPKGLDAACITGTAVDCAPADC